MRKFATMSVNMRTRTMRLRDAGDFERHVFTFTPENAKLLMKRQRENDQVIVLNMPNQKEVVPLAGLSQVFSRRKFTQGDVIMEHVPGNCLTGSLSNFIREPTMSSYFESNCFLVRRLEPGSNPLTRVPTDYQPGSYLIAKTTIMPGEELVAYMNHYSLQ